MSGAFVPLSHASVAIGSVPPVPRAASFVPPPLPCRGDRHDGLTRGQRRIMVGAIVTAHAAAVWGLMQIREVRDAVAEAAPMFVSLIAPTVPPKPAPPPPPPQPALKRPLPAPVIAAPATPAPAAFVVPAPPPEIAEPPVPIVAPPPQLAAAPVAAPAPKVIPASAVQYLEPLAPEYPRLSKRLGETGRVLVRVFIDEAGVATNVQIHRSSGHPRLDDAALAAVQRARFKPYSENGRPVAGWAYIPLDFELEK